MKSIWSGRKLRICISYFIYLLLADGDVLHDHTAVDLTHLADSDVVADGALLDSDALQLAAFTHHTLLFLQVVG